MAAFRLQLALAFIAAIVASTSGTGTIIELHQLPYFGGGDPVWVLPDPTVGSPGAPSGCTNLPKDFTFQSGRFWWNETAGMARCHFIWFFYSPNCGAGGSRGVEVGPAPTDGTPWVSQDAIYARTTYWKIQNGKSVGCSFEEDPCVAFPCEDANAVCNSSLGWSWEDSSKKSWAQQTRNCSFCKPGFAMDADGKCVDKAAACAQLGCQAPGTCEADSGASVYCKCPVGTTLDNSTMECKAASKAEWLDALNTVRDQSTSAASGLMKTAVAAPDPIQWDATLAEVAENWTMHLNATQCGVEPVVLSKIPGGNYSESDVWVSWTTDESSAVQLWAPSPSDTSNPRTARITDANTKLTGCGKTVCGAGAFFTCLFWPKTF